MKSLQIPICILLMMHFYTVKSQFQKLDLMRIDTKTILIENYNQFRLPPMTSKGADWNNYNPDNRETFLEILQDNHLKKAHILIQTDFFGNINYVALSNNINALLNKKDKPSFIFDHCIQEINNGFSNQMENIIILTNCIIDRLEYSIKK